MAKGFRCRVCRRVNPFHVWAYAHWDMDIEGTCAHCGAKHILNSGKVIELDASLAISAAKISVEYKLPMADSIILAMVRAWQATLWTQDEHFKGLQEVQFIEKK